MQTRTLPHTGLTVSRACFGTMTFGGQVDETAAARMVDLCLERGVTFFDTANSYTKTQSETILGRILKGRRDRDRPRQQGRSEDGGAARRIAALAQVDSREPRQQPAPPADRLPRHLLPPHARLRGAARGEPRRDGRGCARGQGAVSRDVELRRVATLPGAVDLGKARI